MINTVFEAIRLFAYVKSKRILLIDRENFVIVDRTSINVEYVESDRYSSSGSETAGKRLDQPARSLAIQRRTVASFHTDGVMIIFVSSRQTLDLL